MKENNDQKTEFQHPSFESDMKWRHTLRGMADEEEITEEAIKEDLGGKEPMLESIGET